MTLELNIEKSHTAKDVLDLIMKHKLQKGDKMKLSTSETLSVLFVLTIVYIALTIYYKKKQNYEYVDALVSGIFKDYKTPEELELSIEREYGVSVEVDIIKNRMQETESERADWTRLSMSNFEKAYGKDEPDYTDVQVNEPNPEYNPWKKEQ